MRWFLVVYSKSFLRLQTSKLEIESFFWLQSDYSCFFHLYFIFFSAQTKKSFSNLKSFEKKSFQYNCKKTNRISKNFINFIILRCVFIANESNDEMRLMIFQPTSFSKNLYKWPPLLLLFSIIQWEFRTLCKSARSTIRTFVIKNFTTQSLLTVLKTTRLWHRWRWLKKLVPTGDFEQNLHCLSFCNLWSLTITFTLFLVFFFSFVVFFWFSTFQLFFHLSSFSVSTQKHHTCRWLRM